MFEVMDVLLETYPSINQYFAISKYLYSEINNQYIENLYRMICWCGLRSISKDFTIWTIFNPVSIWQIIQFLRSCHTKRIFDFRLFFYRNDTEFPNGFRYTWYSVCINISKLVCLSNTLPSFYRVRAPIVGLWVYRSHARSCCRPRWPKKRFLI